MDVVLPGSPERNYKCVLKYFSNYCKDKTKFINGCIFTQKALD